jgi:hypothetical protein
MRALYGTIADGAKRREGAKRAVPKEADSKVVA